MKLLLFLIIVAILLAWATTGAESPAVGIPIAYHHFIHWLHSVHPHV